MNTISGHPKYEELRRECEMRIADHLKLCKEYDKLQSRLTTLLEAAEAYMDAHEEGAVETYEAARVLRAAVKKAREGL